MTAQWWLDTREPKKEVVAAHLVNLMWNGLTHLEADPQLEADWPPVKRGQPQRLR